MFYHMPNFGAFCKMACFRKDLRPFCQPFIQDDGIQRFYDPEIPSTVTGKYKIAVF